MDGRRGFFSSQLLDNIKWHDNDEVKSMLNLDLVKASNKFGTLLHYAATNDNAEIAQHLIDIGSVIDALGKGGKTALMIAVDEDQKATVVVLLKANANIDITDDLGKTALQRAFEDGEEGLKEVFKHFIHRVRADAATFEEAVDKLLDAGCTVLHAVCLDDVQLLEAMQKRGININDALDRPTLHCAAQMGKVAVLKWLIDNGANVNAQDPDGVTPLYHAALWGQEAALRFLLERGANANAEVRSDGSTPLFMAVTSMTEGKEDQDRHTKCVEGLLEYGAVPRNVKHFRRTILDFALELENLETVKLLTEHLVILERLGSCDVKSAMICNDVRNREAFSKIEKDYEMYRETLDIAIFGASTLFDLLSDDKDLRKLRIFVRNEMFAAEVEKICSENKLRERCNYYYRTLMKRIARARRIVELEDEAIPVICKLFEANDNQFYDFARKIVAYLNERDLEQLIQV